MGAAHARGVAASCAHWPAPSRMALDALDECAPAQVSWPTKSRSSLRARLPDRRQQIVRHAGWHAIAAESVEHRQGERIAHPAAALAALPSHVLTSPLHLRWLWRLCTAGCLPQNSGGSWPLCDIRTSPRSAAHCGSIARACNLCRLTCTRVRCRPRTRAVCHVCCSCSRRCTGPAYVVTLAKIHVC